MPATIDTNDIREYARAKYVEPARARHESTIRIVAGEVHKGVRLSNRVPQVCQALKSQKFLNENHLVLEKLEGPPSGLSTTVTFTYRLLDEAGQPPVIGSADWSFGGLRGIAKDVFKSLGGGEAFIRKERERFYGPDKSS